MIAGASSLSCRGLAIGIAGRRLCADLDLDVRSGERWVVVGPNGAGKTTLVAVLAGLRAPIAGGVTYEGAALSSLSPRERARKRGWLP
jgi:iron complex transport system ATP-binding protein